MNRSKIKLITLAAAIFVTILYIFLNSSIDAPTSYATSDRVAEIIEGAVEPIKEDAKITDGFVRKLAHFIEFTILGLELAFLFDKICLFPAFFVIIIGLTDETIQIFSNRGPLVQDVWLDFGGGCFGILLCWLITYLWSKKTTRRREGIWKKRHRS